jgi:non-ribosomal peptide synthetase-like protein
MAVTLLVVLAKWVLMGRYAPGEHAIHSAFVWRHEVVCALMRHVADPLLTERLCGTPFVSWFFRWLGCDIGGRVYLDTMRLYAYDLITVGDGACLDRQSWLKTHLIAPSGLRLSSVFIGAGCTLGASAIALCDTEMEPRSILDPLSLLMKGEVLPSASRWQGTPAAPAQATGGAGTRIWGRARRSTFEVRAGRVLGRRKRMPRRPL